MRARLRREEIGERGEEGEAALCFRRQQFLQRFNELPEILDRGCVKSRMVDSAVLVSKRSEERRVGKECRL